MTIRKEGTRGDGRCSLWAAVMAGTAATLLMSCVADPVPDEELGVFISYGFVVGDAIGSYDAVAFAEDDAIGIAGVSVPSGGGYARMLECSDLDTAPALLPMSPGDAAFGDPPGTALNDPQVLDYLFLHCASLNLPAAGAAELAACEGAHLLPEDTSPETLFLSTAVLDGSVDSVDGAYHGWLEFEGSQTTFVNGVEDATTQGHTKIIEFATPACTP